MTICFFFFEEQRSIRGSWLTYSKKSKKPLTTDKQHLQELVFFSTKNVFKYNHLSLCHWSAGLNLSWKKALSIFLQDQKMDWDPMFFSQTSDEVSGLKTSSWLGSPADHELLKLLFFIYPFSVYDYKSAGKLVRKGLGFLWYQLI